MKIDRDEERSGAACVADSQRHAGQGQLADSGASSGVFFFLEEVVVVQSPEARRCLLLVVQNP